MRAIQCHDGRVWLEMGARAPEPGEGDAIVRVVRAGVDGADIHAATAGSGFSGVLGHRFTGVVEAFGPGVSTDEQSQWQGTRVVGSPDVVCAACDLCRAGLSAHCRERRVMGVLGRDGCLAEYVALPARNLAILDDHVSDDEGVFAPIVATALHAARMIGTSTDMYVTILGDGVLALVCAQVLQMQGVLVRVLGRDASRFTLCEKWSIRHRPIDEAGRRRDQDAVIECGGGSGGLQDAIGFVRPRATVVLARPLGSSPLRGESPQGSSPLRGESPGAIEDAIAIEELHVLGARGGSIAEAAQVLGEGRIDVVSLIAKRHRLDDGPDVLRSAQATGLGVVVEI